MLSRRRNVCYVSGCPQRILTPVQRFLALFVAAALPLGALAADKVTKVRVAKAAVVESEFSADGNPILQSSQVMVLDASSGQTLYSKNADHAAPIASEKIVIERKILFLDLKENQRGRFLKITEDVGGRRDTMMLPAEAFKDLTEALERLIEFESKL